MTDEQFAEILTCADPKPMREMSFHVPGDPVPKGRPKFARKGGFVQAYTPQKTAVYESKVQWYAVEVMADDPRLFMGPLSVYLDMAVAIPASWSKKRQEAAMRGEIAPTKKPDMDNVCKSILDAMNGYVFNDDAQVVRLTMSKRYGEPGVRVLVRELPLEAA